MKASTDLRNVLVRNGLKRWLPAILLTLLGATSVHAQPSASQLDRADRIEIERLISAEAQRIVSGMQRLDGQRMPIRLKVKLDDTGKNLLVELGRGFIPEGSEYIPPKMQLQHQYLSNNIRYLLDETIKVEQIIYLYDGKDIFYYFPDEAPRPKDSPTTDAPPPDVGPGVPLGENTVVVSASHGLYRLYDEQRPLDYVWTEQRPLTNGIREDYLTPSYATELKTWLEDRSDVAARFTRSTSTDVHIPSTTESETHYWWQIAARYYLEQLYPDNPEIWNTYPSSQDVDREYKEDINSRPNYANHINANALINLHTNAAAAAVRGTRVYHATTDAAGQQLGTSILCYMKEIIRAQDGYDDWTIQTDSNPSTDYGENNQADMQAVIVEIGFHTNPDDALALQDPVFRTAAMKGVEKGYRLHEEGEPCQPFEIQSVSDASGPNDTSVPVAVNFEGYPEFPVTMKVEIISCPPSRRCSGGEQEQIEEVPSPMSWNFGCNSPPSSPTATIGVRTTLVDTDGVATDPVDSTVTCATSSGSNANMTADTPQAAAASISEG